MNSRPERRGHVDAVSRTQVSGWAADLSAFDTKLELCVLVDGLEHGRCVADRLRPDLAALGRYGDGRHGFTFAFGPRLDAWADHDIRVVFADDLAVLPNGQQHLARVTAPPALPDALGLDADTVDADGPHPILVTAPGRSGTSFLMACLAASPRIVVAELVPYEVRLLSYYAAAYGVLTAPADIGRSTHPDRLEGDGFHIGFNPFTDTQYVRAFRDREALDEYQSVWAPSRLGAAMGDLVREYYRRLALDAGKGAVPFFAEKNNNLNRASRMFVRRAFATVREVVIVRDPRDVLCSHVAYFESAADKAFAQLTQSSRQLARLADMAGGALHVVRYEDMVRGDAATFAGLSAFLDAPVSPVEAAAGGKMFAQHGTSATPESSVGRWRQDLPEALRARTASEWRGFLEKFGYALS